MIWYWLLLIFGGFLLGSIMFCQLIPKLLLHVDIYDISDDHNPGTFNVYKHCGMKLAVPCCLLDGLKGLIPVLLASLLMDVNTVAFSFVMVAPILGHALGIFNRFHGGKCIATSFGVMLGIIPVSWIGIVVLPTVFILLSTVVKINSRNLRCMVVYILFAVITCPIVGVLGQIYVAIGCGLISLFPIVKFAISKFD